MIIVMVFDGGGSGGDFVIMRMVMAYCHPHQLLPLLAVSLSHFFPGGLYLDNSSSTDCVYVCVCVCGIEIKSISRYYT